MVNSQTDLDVRLEKILKEVFQVEKLRSTSSIWNTSFKIFSNLVSKSVLESTIN